MNSAMTHQRGFTLGELLITIVILAFMFAVFGSFLGAVSRAWTSGEQQVATFQDGRAILDTMRRELSGAAISPSLQFVAFNNFSGTRANSDSIFWQAPLTYRVSGSSAPLTNLCEVGYYIDASYNLKRFFVQPADSNYKIYDSVPADTSASWVTNLTNTSTTIATGVVAMWVRCMDANGDFIPWYSTPLHFNSAQHFRPAVLGTSNSFTYTASSTNTAQANLLPNAVEVTIVVVDPGTLKRNLTIPAMPTITAPANVPAAVASFNGTLITNHISSARTFTTQIPVPNSFRQ